MQCFISISLVNFCLSEVSYYNEDVYLASTIFDPTTTRSYIYDVWHMKVVKVVKVMKLVNQMSRYCDGSYTSDGCDGILCQR